MKLISTRAVTIVRLGLALAGVAGLAACTPTSDQNTSAVQALIATINNNAPLNSDVRITTNGSDDVKDDKVVVNVRTVAKAGGTLSPLYTVTFTRADVTFTRRDGFNKPGVDVPLPFSEAIAVTVPPGAQATFSITLVSHLMKLEPPLRNLWFQGGELEITTTATIALFGEDLAGNKVTAVGSFAVFFADFADSSG